mgnify:FL=1
MINEERVRELYQMAVYDEHEDKKCHPMGEYYIWDYVGKELIKSFFSGTIVFCLMIALWVAGDMTAAITFVNSTDLMNLIIWFILIYVGFMAIYLLMTVFIYSIRYAQGRKELHKYVGHLKKVRKMYRREDKLKA